MTAPLRTSLAARTLAVLAACAAVTGLATAPALADELVVPAAGAMKLAGAGGWTAWSMPNEDTGWHLVVRAPDGTVSTPAIDDFTSPPQVSIGSDQYPAGRHLLVVYSRRSGGDQDLYAFDLQTMREHRVSPVSSSTYDEEAPSLQLGLLSFVRRGGRRPGLYAWFGHGSARRLTSYTPRETATSQSRVAYPAGRSVIVRHLSGRGGALVFTSPSRPRSVRLSRYRATWLGDEGAVFQTPRFAGSGGPYPTSGTLPADRRLPGSSSGIAAGPGDFVDWYLDGAGLNRVSPPLKFGS